MSETLEAIARALFESWFVRFNPVRRNMARKGRGQPSPPPPLPEGEGKAAPHYRGGYDFAGLVERARELRCAQTPAEEIFGDLVRDRRFLGLKFRRQHQIGDYVVDFYCHEHCLVVEFDGGVHSERREEDHKRDAWLKARGYKVLRFPNEQLWDDPDTVLRTLADVVKSTDNPPSPSGRRVGDEGSVEELDRLFPDRLVDSELGPIPEGWKVARMNDVLADIVSGGRPKGGAVEEGVPSVGAENVIGLGKYDFSKEKYIPREFFEELQRKGAAVRPGDVLLYKDGAQIGRKTYFDCGFPHTKCAVNEHVFILRAQHPRYQRYLFFWLDQGWMTQEIISLNSNSAQPGINQQGVRSLPCLIPQDPVLDAFDHFSKPLMDRLFFTCIESRTLAALRDALLPKLISGKIRVKDAERFLKERGL